MEEGKLKKYVLSKILSHQSATQIMKHLNTKGRGNVECR